MKHITHFLLTNTYSFPRLLDELTQTVFYYTDIHAASVFFLFSYHLQMWNGKLYLSVCWLALLIYGNLLVLHYVVISIILSTPIFGWVYLWLSCNSATKSHVIYRHYIFLSVLCSWNILIFCSSSSFCCCLGH